RPLPQRLLLHPRPRRSSVRRRVYRRRRAHELQPRQRHEVHLARRPQERHRGSAQSGVVHPSRDRADAERAEMNIITPYARIMDVSDAAAGIALLKKIEWCGRVSHRSEDAATDDSYDRFLRAVVIGHGDWSIVEHASATVDFYV